MCGSIFLHIFIYLQFVCNNKCAGSFLGWKTVPDMN